MQCLHGQRTIVFGQKTFRLLNSEEAEQEQWRDKIIETLLVSEDRRSGLVTAHSVDCKGPGDRWAVRRVVRDMGEGGYKGCTLRTKTDQEPAVIQFQNAVSEERQGEARQASTILLSSAAHDWKQNGRVENAVKRLKGMMRAFETWLTDQLEHAHYPRTLHLRLDA